MFLSNKFNYLVVTSAALILSACASTPQMDIEQAGNYSQYKTFQWQYSQYADLIGVEDPAYYTPLFEKKLATAVGKIMQEQGLTGSEEPDLYLTHNFAAAGGRNSSLINIRANRSNRLYSSVDPRFSTPGVNGVNRRTGGNLMVGAPGSAGSQSNDIYVIVNAFDAKTKQLVWSDSTKIKRRMQAPSQEKVAFIAEEILANFPSQL